MWLIELSCLAVLASAVALRRLGPGAREWAGDAPIVALGALVGEDSCIRLYDFYEYAPGWHLFVDRTPLLIPVIWVFVVLSARDVARALGPRAVVPMAFLLILIDALLIEPISTHAGLWRWKVAGPLGVPWIGTLGWACYGACALFWLGRLKGPARWLTVALAPLCLHALLLALWWGGLRWVGRETPGQGAVAIGAWVVAALAIAALLATKRARALPLWTVTPRILPALFFFGLLAVRTAPLPLWLYAAGFAPPWLAAIRWVSPPRS
ncbi:MAG: hypothetical protein ACYC8T_24810 [Myxococcaceae bacterium]